MRISELEVVRIPIGELKPYDNNAKLHTREQIDAVEASIKEFGFRNPVIAWHNEDGIAEIVAGHARTTAARNLGMDEVPCIFVDDLTDAQRRALTLADNQTTMMTGFDEDMLAYELDVLADEFDMADFGFADSLGDAIEDVDVEEDEVPEVVECRAKKGEIWQLGAHRIMCGDSTCREDVEKLVGGGFCDLLLTDPPYNVALGQHMRPSELKQLHRRTDGLVIENDSWDDDDAFVAFLKSAFDNAMEVLNPGAAFYIWHADSQRMNFLRACELSGMTVRECLVWAKNTFALGRQDYQWRHEPCLYGWKDGAAHSWYSDRKQSTVLEFDKPSVNAEHPTMKPVGLMAYLIRNSTKEGDTVLDVFGGSGSTLMACEGMGRKCLSMELDPHYCDVIIARWENATGKTALRLE